MEIGHRVKLAARAAACVAATLLCGCVTSIVGPEDAERGSWIGSPYVRVLDGVVRGHRDSDETFVWRGIPYASPPVGELRWKAPRPAEPWSGVLDARRFGAACTQYTPLLRGRIVGSEDCLYLNVWRPDTREVGLPVYVWIHGGGNSIGSASFVPDYYGHALASSQNLVFVSVNYRLGPFGWFTSEAIRDQSDPRDASGNYGTLDLIAALEWVRDNIASFGGDPRRVTIAGESAGGINVLSLMVSPLADGLFHRAIVESGAVQSSTIEEGDRASTPVFDRSSGGVAGVGALEAARELDDRTLLRMSAPGTMGMTGGPALFPDGYVLPEEGLETIFSGGRVSNVPLIIGSNKTEVKLFLWFSRDLRWRSDLYQAVGTYSSALWKADAVDAVARELTSRPDRAPVYAYRFDWGAPNDDGKSPLPGNWPRILGAFHTLEIPFFLRTDTINGRVFGALLFNRRNRPGRKALSREMSDSVGRFARTGDPNGSSDRDDDAPADSQAAHTGEPIVVWERWSNDPGGPKSIVFDVDGDVPAISMMHREYTREAIYDEIRSKVSPSIRDELLERLESR